PFGFLTEAAARAAAEAGFRIVEWTVSVGDWERERRAEEITGAILARVRPGDVIVLHDGDRTHHRSRERWCVRSPSWRTITSPGRTRARIAPVISSARRSRSQSPTDTVHSTIRKPASAAARAAASVRKPK